MPGAGGLAAGSREDSWWGEARCSKVERPSARSGRRGAEGTPSPSGPWGGGGRGPGGAGPDRGGFGGGVKGPRAARRHSVEADGRGQGSPPASPRRPGAAPTPARTIPAPGVGAWRRSVRNHTAPLGWGPYATAQSTWAEDQRIRLPLQVPGEGCRRGQRSALRWPAAVCRLPPWPGRRGVPLAAPGPGDCPAPGSRRTAGSVRPSSTPPLLRPRWRTSGPVKLSLPGAAKAASLERSLDSLRRPARARRR
jgi:hypothetical protein